MEKIREPKFAGLFYPKNPEELKEKINFYIHEAEDIKIDGSLKGLVVPHAAYIYSGRVAGYAYKLVKQFPGIENVVMLGPSHQEIINAPVCDNSDEWKTPLGETEINKELAQKLDISFSSDGHKNEHSLEVQLPFLQETLKNFKIVPVAINEPRPDFAKKLAENNTEKTLILVSSDLSHYLQDKQAETIDKKTIEQILNHDAKTEKHSYDACGNSGIYTICSVAKQKNRRAKLLRYRNSGDIAGDRRSVVGYAAIAFYSPN
jgi:hypothetical protein